MADNASQGSIDSVTETLLIEVSKILLSSSLATTRGAMQMLQGVTGVLLASYTSLLIGFGKAIGIDKIPIVAAILPIVFYVLSLIIAFWQIARFKGEDMIIGDLLSGFNAYEAIIAAQRKQLILPLSLSLAGIVSVVVVIQFLLNVL